MIKVPFESRIFWKVLPTVYILVIIVWVLFVQFGGYDMKPADWGGSFLSATILAYLVHLWMLPGDYAHHDDADPMEDDEPPDDLDTEPTATQKHADDA